MKILPALLVVAVFAIACWGLSHRYEFHTDTIAAGGMKIPALWRCDRLTGKVELTTTANQQWTQVKEPLPVFDPSKPYTVESPAKPKMSAEQFLDSTNVLTDAQVGITNKLDLQPVPDWAKDPPKTNSSP